MKRTLTIAATILSVALCCLKEKVTAEEVKHPVQPKTEGVGEMVGIQWVPIPGGTFSMGTGSGDESPAHKIVGLLQTEWVIFA
ncbi:MAG: hypothetical protein HYX59_14205 [Elusimicrobia bacterium]|nr:hypothetical protein [Elusimicrobiota bacterium]